MNKHYEQFNASDFVIDDAFLKHYLSPTDASKAFWENWLANHPEKKATWLEAQQLIEAVLLGLSDYVRTYLSKEAEEHLLQRILNTNAEHDEVQNNIIPIWRQSWFQVLAACVVLFCGLNFWYQSRNVAEYSMYQKQIAALSEEKLTEIINTTTQEDTVRLPDGSVVFLSPKSKITYASDFGNENRTVYLSGKGVFEVVKMPSKPFFVYANEIVTKVVGTKFEVLSYDNDKQVIVKVLSGKVSVFRNPDLDENKSTGIEKQGVLLKPNQQVVFSREKELFKKAIVAEPLLLSSATAKELKFEYEETSVVKVFDDIAQAYGVEIVFNREMLQACELTSSMAEESLQDKLNIVCKTIGANYEIIDAQIIINAKPCKPN